ncbi:MAG: tRNA uridine(34) 5-carboxymethylaminomethyl modification radical SAM/GNAT enzyme Elp3 [Candidatus Peregrinibacteria bacterium]|nr:tRNA uridine(34) 5-carboxymethylaminomethyl modification radical SAM/GNAT enzyme Elp3 [Candidatus Peregrinibacteria bacterium]
MKTQSNNKLEAFIRQAIRHDIRSEKELTMFKKKFARENAVDTPSNIQVIKTYRALTESGKLKEVPEFLKIFRKRKIRSLAGVSVLTVLTKPFYCPGKCVFCPTEQGMPKSYLSNEPGAMRAVLADFDPKKQITTRIKSLTNQGHPTDKTEVIVLGGTFSAYPHAYQTSFVRQLYNALNGTKFRSLEKAQKFNETAKHRAIALSLETRPDHVTKDELKRFRKLGCTKIQIGIQSLSDEVLQINKRGETVKQGREAIKLIRDAGYKFSIHMMPNLPGSNPTIDYEMMKQVFEDPAYKPDFLKLYPCIVVPFSELEHWWRRGEYEAYDDETLTNLIVRIKKIVPEYLRIDRLIRDIPGDSIIAGSLITNLRQLIQQKRDNDGTWECRCIRCREIRGRTVNPADIIYKEQTFDASDGKEFFLTFEDQKQDKLLSLLRLRFHSYLYSGKRHFISELNDAAIIREVHTYGFQVEIGRKHNNSPQHLGLGRKLIEKAEAITRNAGIKKLAVIASIGTREYYRKWGYKLEGTYMVKHFK